MNYYKILRNEECCIDTERGICIIRIKKMKIKQAKAKDWNIICAKKTKTKTPGQKQTLQEKNHSKWKLSCQGPQTEEVI